MSYLKYIIMACFALLTLLVYQNCGEMGSFDNGAVSFSSTDPVPTEYGDGGGANTGGGSDVGSGGTGGSIGGGDSTGGSGGTGGSSGGNTGGSSGGSSGGNTGGSGGGSTGGSSGGGSGGGNDMSYLETALINCPVQTFFSRAEYPGLIKNHNGLQALRTAAIPYPQTCVNVDGVMVITRQELVFSPAPPCLSCNSIETNL